VVRVRNVTGTSFEVRFQEWNYLDGWHPFEKVHWLVVERGAWQVDTGTLLIADAIATSDTDFANPTAVRFPLEFSSAPVVVATQQSANGGDAVTERISGVGTGRFSVVLQEEEAQGPHCAETVGYVAIGPGTGGQSAGAVDITPALGAPAGWEIYVVEEQSADSETSHCWEQVGHLLFGGVPAGEPPFVAEMQTAYGPDTCSLRCRQASPSALLSGLFSALGALRGAVPARAACTLKVDALGPSGVELGGVAVTVELIPPQGERRTLMRLTPFELTCAPGSQAVLTAPASVVLDGEALGFERWLVDGAPEGPGGPALELRLEGDRAATARYTGP